MRSPPGGIAIQGMSVRTRAIRAARLGMICIGLAMASIPTIAQSAHKVLILDEGDFTRPFFVAHALAIRAYLTTEPPTDIEVDIEMLDLDRYPDADHRSKLTRLLGDKHRRRPPDVIIVQGPRALDFAAGLRDSIGLEIPLVYTSIEDSEVRRLTMPSRTTGVSTRNNVVDQVKFVQQIIPETRNIAIVGNTALPGTYPVNIDKEFQEIGRLVNVISLIDLPIGELIRRVADLPMHTVIFYYGIKPDKSGRVFLPQEGLTTLSQVANCPIIVPTNNLMGFGAAGGLMLRPQDGTREVAAVTRRILSGEDVANIKPIRLETRKPVFDYRQIKKWGIDRSLLPRDSELLFYEPTLWERYSREIIVVMLILFVQSATIIMLIIEHRRRRRAELEFRRSLTDLAQLNRATALGELSASIAHELNQPLAAMLSNAEAADAMLHATPPAIEEAARTLADIRRDNQRASGIIRSMRSMFRKTGFAPAPVKLNEVVREMLRFVAWEARSQGVQLTTDIGAGTDRVMGDRIQLDQVVLNLLTNAIESAKSNSEQRVVNIGTRETGDGEVELFVEDSGPGISEEALPRIFEPYYTTKDQGMGMGLSISRNIIEAHGSRLNVGSRTGGGARFWFALKTV